MGKPLADYVKLPELEEYKEWFKNFADLHREDGILQVTWKTNDGPMHHSGMSHRAISQLVRVLSLDYKNEIIIFTHIGDNWMIESLSLRLGDVFWSCRLSVSSTNILMTPILSRICFLI